MASLFCYLLVRRPAQRVGGCRDGVVFVVTGSAAAEPHHDAVAHGLASMPVANPVLQDPVEQRRPFGAVAIAVLAHQLDHRILHEVQRLIPVAHADFGDTQGTPFHFGQKPVELRSFCSARVPVDGSLTNDTAYVAASAFISLDSATRSSNLSVLKQRLSDPAG